MSVRTQITLSDLQYRGLKREAERRGRSLADLIRSAVANTYGYPRDDDNFDTAVDACAGIWADRVASADEYLAQTRPARPTLTLSS